MPSLSSKRKTETSTPRTTNAGRTPRAQVRTPRAKTPRTARSATRTPRPRPVELKEHTTSAFPLSKKAGAGATPRAVLVSGKAGDVVSGRLQQLCSSRQKLFGTIVVMLLAALSVLVVYQFLFLAVQSTPLSTLEAQLLSAPKTARSCGPTLVTDAERLRRLFTDRFLRLEPVLGTDLFRSAWQCDAEQHSRHGRLHEFADLYETEEARASSDRASTICSNTTTSALPLVAHALRRRMRVYSSAEEVEETSGPVVFVVENLLSPRETRLLRELSTSKTDAPAGPQRATAQSFQVGKMPAWYRRVLLVAQALAELYKNAGGTNTSESNPATRSFTKNNVVALANSSSSSPGSASSPVCHRRSISWSLNTASFKKRTVDAVAKTRRGEQRMKPKTWSGFSPGLLAGYFEERSEEEELGDWDVSFQMILAKSWLPRKRLIPNGAVTFFLGRVAGHSGSFSERHQRGFHSPGDFVLRGYLHPARPAEEPGSEDR
ncbi:unnamed protein product [Amoebophrya sp. A120]|nr:unnamed protein product [Amoebophrya sp. A120]|eukprot:GSA120T00017528001.1